MSTATATVTPIKATKSTTPRKPRATTAERELAKLRAENERRSDAARRGMRRLAGMGAGLVWFVDLYASYFHTCELAVRHGQSQSLAHMLPLSIDGLMLIAAIAVVALRGAWMPKLTFLFGASATIAANILSVQGHDVIGYGIAGLVAVSLIGSAELLLRLWLPAPVAKAPRAR